MKGPYEKNWGGRANHNPLWEDADKDMAEGRVRGRGTENDRREPSKGWCGAKKGGHGKTERSATEGVSH